MINTCSRDGYVEKYQEPSEPFARHVDEWLKYMEPIDPHRMEPPFLTNVLTGLESASFRQEMFIFGTWNSGKIRFDWNASKSETWKRRNRQRKLTVSEDLELFLEFASFVGCLADKCLLLTIGNQAGCQVECRCFDSSTDFLAVVFGLSKQDDNRIGKTVCFARDCIWWSFDNPCVYWFSCPFCWYCWMLKVRDWKWSSIVETYPKDQVLQTLYSLQTCSWPYMNRIPDRLSRHSSVLSSRHRRCHHHVFQDHSRLHCSFSIRKTLAYFPFRLYMQL